MNLVGQVGSVAPGGFRCSVEQSMQIAIRRNDECDRSSFLGNHRGGTINDAADRRVFDFDDPGVRNQRSEPVKEIQDLWPGNPREEIFVASRKSNDFMRENRAENE